MVNAYTITTTTITTTTTTTITTTTYSISIRISTNNHLQQALAIPNHKRRVTTKILANLLISVDKLKIS